MKILAAVLMILLALFLLLCLTRVHVQVVFGGGETEIGLRIGWFRILPRPKTHKSRKAGAKKAEPTEEKQPKKTAANRFRFSPAALRDGISVLWPPLRRALGRTRRGVRVDPLDICVCVGGQEDPASAAKTYGQLYGAVWSGMPLLERLVTVPAPHIRVEVDFQTVETTIRGKAGADIRIGTLLAAAVTVGLPALRWLMKRQKEQTENTTAQPESTAA